MKTERAEPALLRRINERRILEAIQRSGPSSRATLARQSGLTPPTVSKVIDSLLTRGLVEELDQARPPLGRPHKLITMATTSAAVLGVVIDAGTCCVTETGLDGRVTEEKTLRICSITRILPEIWNSGSESSAFSCTNCRRSAWPSGCMAAPTASTTSRCST
jgi:hypothetical protein